MEERWITIGSYSDIRQANADADLLKTNGVHCRTNLDEPDSAFIIERRRDDWVFLEIEERDFEEAADLLGLEPYTVDDFIQQEDREQLYAEERQNRRTSIFLWWGLVSIVVLIKLLAEGW